MKGLSTFARMVTHEPFAIPALLFAVIAIPTFTGMLHERISPAITFLVRHPAGEQPSAYWHASILLCTFFGYIVGDTLRKEVDRDALRLIPAARREYLSVALAFSIFAALLLSILLPADTPALTRVSFGALLLAVFFNVMSSYRQDGKWQHVAFDVSLVLTCAFPALFMSAGYGHPLLAGTVSFAAAAVLAGLEYTRPMYRGSDGSAEQPSTARERRQWEGGNASGMQSKHTELLSFMRAARFESSAPTSKKAALSRYVIGVLLLAILFRALYGDELNSVWYLILLSANPANGPRFITTISREMRARVIFWSSIRRISLVIGWTVVVWRVSQLLTFMPTNLFGLSSGHTLSPIALGASLWICYPICLWIHHVVANKASNRATTIHQTARMALSVAAAYMVATPLSLFLPYLSDSFNLSVAVFTGVALAVAMYAAYYKALISRFDKVDLTFALP